jgi:hypothetical protein
VDEFLSPKASAVIKAARRGLRATPADRQRIEAALRARIGPQPFSPSSAATPAAHQLGLGLAAGATLAVCFVGGWLFLSGSEPSLPVEGPATRPPPPTSVQPAPVVEPPLALSDLPTAPPVDATPAPAVSRLAPTRASQDRLAQEVALLSRATSALRSGRAQDALKVLNEHQREFPNGVLGQERSAAKAQALCSLGRVSEGRVELGRLAPDSPAARRAMKACDLPPTAARDKR